MMRQCPTLMALAIAACRPGPSPAGSATVMPTVGAASMQATAAAVPSGHGDHLARALPDATDSGARETRLIARMLKRVERVRGLDASKRIPGVLLDRDALIAQVKKHVSCELPPEAIHNEGLALQLLGFVPLQFDYEAAEYHLLEEQLAGYYEPADGTMYMASDLGDDEANATLAHELVHALQDQHYNLQERSKYRQGDGDRSEAVSALAEGDATSAMFDVMITQASPGAGRTALDLPDELFADQIRRGMSQLQETGAPRVMRSSLAAPYIYGTLFVHALRRRGGWEAVDRAWTDPPTTSEQIMHVDKWLAHEPPLRVQAPPFATLGSGWKAADEDSEGELGTRVAFEEWMDETKAAEASAGWGGDRGVLLRNGSQAAFAWRLRYDSGKTPNERTNTVFPALAHAVDRTLGKPTMSDAAFDCHDRSDRGPLAIARIGRDIVFLAGPTTTSDSAPWKSLAGCAIARKWVREIGETP
jgi:hypothetical protein